MPQSSKNLKVMDLGKSWNLGVRLRSKGQSSKLKIVRMCKDQKSIEFEVHMLYTSERTRRPVSLKNDSTYLQYISQYIHDMN